MRHLPHGRVAVVHRADVEHRQLGREKHEPATEQNRSNSPRERESPHRQTNYLGDRKFVRRLLFGLHKKADAPGASAR
jgi:hypothetical protein